MEVWVGTRGRAVSAATAHNSGAQRAAVQAALAAAVERAVRDNSGAVQAQRAAVEALAGQMASLAPRCAR